MSKSRHATLTVYRLQLTKIQPLPSLRKGCVPRNFKQVECYVQVGIFLSAYATLAIIRAQF